MVAPLLPAAIGAVRLIRLGRYFFSGPGEIAMDLPSPRLDLRVRLEVTGVDKAVAMVEAQRRELRLSVARALTRTAVQVRSELQASLRTTFDRPTGYTMRSLFLQPATPERLEARVWLKDDRAGGGTPATDYLGPQVFGGRRRLKRLEQALTAAGALPAGWFAVPASGARLDAYGNVSRGQIIQVLSQLRITLVAGFTRNMSFDPSRAIAAQRRAGGRFFVIRPGAAAAPGVYQREFNGRNITPVFLFVRRVTYSPRWDFDGIARTAAVRAARNARLELSQGRLTIGARGVST